MNGECNKRTDLYLYHLYFYELTAPTFPTADDCLWSVISPGDDSYGIPDQDGFRACCPTMSREHIRCPDPQGFPVHRQGWKRPGTQTHARSLSMESLTDWVHCYGMLAHVLKHAACCWLWDKYNERLTFCLHKRRTKATHKGFMG